MSWSNESFLYDITMDMISDQGAEQTPCIPREYTNNDIHRITGTSHIKSIIKTA